MQMQQQAGIIKQLNNQEVKNFNHYDYKDWEQFRMGENKNTITPQEFQLVCDLHAKYYDHNFYKPCTCSPKTINKWIKDLNTIWDRGILASGN